MPKESKVLGIGDAAPGFTLRDASTGETVGLGELAVRPLFLFFGRGTW